MPHHWAKLEQDDDKKIIAWHSISDHSADVAACFEALLKYTLLRHRLATLAEHKELDDVQIQRLCVFAALHDVGKFNHGFQNKCMGKSQNTSGHLTEIMTLFDGSWIFKDVQKRCISSLEVRTLCSWLQNPKSLKSLLAATWSHHGRPLKYRALQDPWMWREHQKREDPFIGVHALMQKVKSWFPLAFEGESEALPSSPAFGHGLCGIITLADWLGSSTQFFPLANGEVGDRMTFARARAKEIIKDIGLDPLPARTAMGNKQPKFDNICEHPPRPMQALIDEQPLPSDASIMVLEAETGSGKTEAAFLRYVKLFHAGEVDGLYFALPTRTAAMQLYRRTCAMIKRAFPDKKTRPPVVLAVPGYLNVDGREGKKLARFEVLWPDDLDQRQRHRAWAGEHSKRYLSGSVVVGTIDQILLSTVRVNHAHMRAISSWRHLLVIDEVHASDAYMTRLTEAVLARHAKAGGHALLMSATLGAVVRERLLNPEVPLPPKLTSLLECVEVPYPLLSTTIGPAKTLWRQQPRPDSASTDKVVNVEIKNDMSTPEAIARAALEAAQRGARVLVIRNTVSGALETQRCLEQLANTSAFSTRWLFAVEGIITLHHSRFSREDRQSLDAQIEVQLGHESTKPCVVIATQTVQQSLDLDADLLLTDLCPMDVLLQRVGRLHRHARSHRPAGFENPRVVVLTPPARDLSAFILPSGSARGVHGLGTVYEDLRILEATWLQLEHHDTLCIPSMNRALVEHTTHPEALSEIVDSLGGLWLQHARAVDGVTRAKDVIANLALVDWSKEMGTYEFHSTQDERVRTRLGEGNLLVHFDPAPVGPFGHQLSSLTIPAHLLNELPQEGEASEVETGEGWIRFKVEGQTFEYDRSGLKALLKI